MKGTVTIIVRNLENKASGVSIPPMNAYYIVAVILVKYLLAPGDSFCAIFSYVQ